MSHWTDFFPRIVLLNLPERTDRLIEATEELNKQNIPFELVNAIKNEKGAEGLRDTMVKLFKECIENGTERLLVFEDDVEWLDFDVAGTMDAVIQQLPDNFRLLYLGSQCSRGFTHYHSPNLLPVIGAFATHACAYSLKVMKECVGRIGSPIDNWLCDEIQPLGDCYQTFPMLASQRDGFSSIGGQFFSWKPFLEQRFDQKIAELNMKRCNR
jgi:hypothetical protein